MDKRNAIAWSGMEDLLVKLGEALERPAKLCVIGSAVCMHLGQPSRMTMDIDVWRRDSQFDLGDLKRACKSLGIEFDPKGFDEPQSVYIQMIEPGVVQLGAFDETMPMFNTGNLQIRRPPIENIIASKMVRGEPHDFQDSAFLMKKCNVSMDKVSKAIQSIADEIARENAMGNFEMMSLYVNAKPEMTKKPAASNSRIQPPM